MKLQWLESAWEEYLSWQSENKKTLKRINLLIKDIQRNGHIGIGKSEPLSSVKSGWWSRRIDEKNRLVYKIIDNALIVASCKYHYIDN